MSWGDPIEHGGILDEAHQQAVIDGIQLITRKHCSGPHLLTTTTTHALLRTCATWSLLMSFCAVYYLVLLLLIAQLLLSLILTLTTFSFPYPCMIKTPISVYPFHSYFCTLLFLLISLHPKLSLTPLLYDSLLHFTTSPPITFLSAHNLIPSKPSHPTSPPKPCSPYL